MTNETAAAIVAILLVFAIMGFVVVFGVP